MRDKLHYLFLNVGHFLDHLFMLVFATVAALALGREWNMSYGELIPYATPGFIAFGAFALPAYTISQDPFGGGDGSGASTVTLSFNDILSNTTGYAMHAEGTCRSNIIANNRVSGHMEWTLNFEDTFEYNVISNNVVSNSIGKSLLDLDGTTVHVLIEDEQGKLNLNELAKKGPSKRIKRELTRLVGDLGHTDADIDDVVESISDWIDSDNDGEFEDDCPNRELTDLSDVLPTLAGITGAKLPEVELDGRSFWPQCLGQKGSPRQWIFQYYYPKFAKAAEKHGQGVRRREIVWAQNQHYKLYRDGTLYAVKDRHEATVIEPGTNQDADATRALLQGAIDSMPKKAARLRTGRGD